MTDENTRTFYVCNELGLNVLLSARLEEDGYHLSLEPLPDELGDIPDDGSGVIFLDVPDVGALSPDILAIVKQGRTFAVTPSDRDLVAWLNPMRLDESCVAESSGFGFLLKLMTVQEVGDAEPTLVIARGPRLFRVTNELAVPIQVVTRLEDDRFVMAVDKDPRDRSGFGAAMVASALIEDDDAADPYCHRVTAVDDGEDEDSTQETYFVEPGGYFSVVLTNGELPTWHEPADLMKLVRADIGRDAPPFALDVFSRPNEGLLTNVIIAEGKPVLN